MDIYKIIKQGGIGEIIEKKSRFIAEVIPIKTEEDAISFIELTRKKHWNASHNCSAYVLGDNNEIERCSDDGEPSRTAGRPMLNILLMEGIHNTAVVVTRYFGGVLLGAGGLMRAYQAAVKEGLKNCIIADKMPAAIYHVVTDYNGIGKLQYIAGNMGLKILDMRYTDIVEADVLITLDKEDGFINTFQEAAGGRAGITKDKDICFTEIDGEIILL